MGFLRAAGKTAATLVPTAQLARLGLPALIAAGVLLVLILAAGCWILASDGPAARLACILDAWRGNPIPDPPTTAPQPTRRGRRRPRQ